MEGLEEKLNDLLKDPNLMEKLSEAAKSLSLPGPASEDPDSGLSFDPAMLGRLSGLARQGSVDPQQQALLSALTPYLSQERVSRLQRAMQAAKMAKLASSIGGLSLFTGR